MRTCEVFGVLLVGAPVASVSGACNHSGLPVEGTVLVAETLGPELYDALLSSVAVICANGGRTGHMESLCRSRGIPVLRVDRPELDRLVGEVTIRLDRQSVILCETESPVQQQNLHTTTAEDLRSICVVIADATDVQGTNALTPRVEQVTTFFVREEFVCYSANLSPVDALRSGVREAEEYGAAIGSELCTIAKELLPGQRLVMRLLDLRSDDAAQITTSVEVGEEPNPDMGLHGARWLLREPNYPTAFRALRAYVRERLGPDAAQVSFAVPFINDHNEFLELRQHLGLSDDTQLAVFVETPAAVHSAPEFCRAGASEIFVGTKDLVQFYLAADRSNHLVAASYQTQHPAILAGLRQVVRAARHAGTPVHVFALAADLDHYVKRLPTNGFMMCTAEVAQLPRT